MEADISNIFWREWLHQRLHLDLLMFPVLWDWSSFPWSNWPNPIASCYLIYADTTAGEATCKSVYWHDLSKKTQHPNEPPKQTNKNPSHPPKTKPKLGSWFLSAVFLQPGLWHGCTHSTGSTNGKRGKCELYHQRQKCVTVFSGCGSAITWKQKWGVPSWPFILSSWPSLHRHGAAGTKKERTALALLAVTYPGCFPGESFSKISVAVAKQIDMLDLYLLMVVVDLVIPQAWQQTQWNEEQ